SEFIEGYIENFEPLSKDFTVLPENSLEKERALPRNQIAWICLINDFSNIPRYIKALNEKPECGEKKPTQQLYKFDLVNGTTVFGQVDLFNSKDEGFWITPYFQKDDLSGRVYLYSSKIKESAP